MDAPPWGFEEDAEQFAAMREALLSARPLLVFVGLGFPKQDLLIERLRGELPETWFVGCGSAIAFAGGAVVRAPGVDAAIEGSNGCSGCSASRRGWLGVI